MLAMMVMEGWCEWCDDGGGIKEKYFPFPSWGTNVHLSTRQPSSGLCRPQTTSASNDLFDYVHKCGTCGSRFVHRALPLDYADLGMILEK